MSNETIKWYNRRAKRYCEDTFNLDVSNIMDKFLKYLGHKGRILDAGCGSGRDSLQFISRGYDVELLDGSLEVCKIASRNVGKMVEWSDLRDINYRDEFDGIWAMASLLHISKRELPQVINNMHSALRNGGVIYASFKYGDGERTINGKLYSDFNENSIKELFRWSGFRIIEYFITYGDEKYKRDKWINIIVKK